MNLPSGMASKILLATALATVSAAVARADVVMDWNAKADAIAAEKQVLPAQRQRGAQLGGDVVLRIVQPGPGETIALAQFARFPLDLEGPARGL